MIFQYSWQVVLDGSKTQTRRIQKPGEFPVSFDNDDSWVIVCVMNKTHSNALTYGVGQDYALQPGRGKPAIIWHPNHPCYGIDIIQPGDNHYQSAKDGYMGMYAR